jgi:ABC-type glycerol-3-phosphate transport system permease component
MPILIPGISLLIPTYILIRKLGLMNSYLGLILMHSTGMLTLGIFLMRNAFMSIPKSLREVALLEGSSELRIMFSVMLPLAIPGLLTLMVFALYGSWNDFILAFLFINSTDMEMLNIFLMKIALGGSQFDTFWGLLNAGAIISFLPIILFYIFLQQYFVRGVTGSAVKE